MGSRLSFDIFSDGGGERSRAAAAAAVIREIHSSREQRLALFLGAGTNNEAEIIGGLIGFSFLRAFEMAEGGGVDRVRWVSDSEYVLKSASEYIVQWQRNGWRTASRAPVKNQGLWRAYLELSAGLRIHFAHVRGHSGHLENEACDAVTTWLQERGEAFLGSYGEGESIEVDATPLGRDWKILDGRPFLEALRNNAPTLEAIHLLANKLRSLELTELAHPHRKSSRSPKLSASRRLIARVEELRVAADELRRTDPTAKKIYDSLSDLLKEIRSRE